MAFNTYVQYIVYVYAYPFNGSNDLKILRLCRFTAHMRALSCFNVKMNIARGTVFRVANRRMRCNFYIYVGGCHCGLKMFVRNFFPRNVTRILYHLYYQYNVWPFVFKYPLR